MTRVRLRFRKEGDLRFLSHHDLMRLFERLLRRADLPFKSSEGFHPKPLMRFPSALSLGIVGHEEVIEIDLIGALDAGAVARALAALVPEGITILGAKALPPRTKGQPLFVEYVLPLSPAHLQDLEPRIDVLLMQSEIWIERGRQRDFGRPADEALGEERLDAPLTVSAGKSPPGVEVKRLDLRPYLKQLRQTPTGLEMQFHVTQSGTARPEEVLRQLGLERLLQEGEAVLERTRLVLADEFEPLAVPADASACAEPLPMTALLQKA